MALRSSKLQNNSKVGKSNVSFGGGSQTRKVVGVQSTTEFSKHLLNLQKHAEENIEDEYIKNLQQQIAYMELELKLLKEKEMEQKASVSQIDRFFNDGVPLNENILALKNQYNATKKEYEDKIDELHDKRLEEEKAQRDLKNQHNIMQAKLQDLNLESKQKVTEYEKSIKELRFALIAEKNTKDSLSKELKALQEEMKQVNTDNLNMQRDLERKRMHAPATKENDEVIRNKRKREIAAKDEIITKLQDEVEALFHKTNFNPMHGILENENKDLQEKILRCDKEINIAKSRINEMKMQLESRAREREREGDQRREMIEKINVLKAEIDKQNRVNELVIEQKVKEKEQKEIRDIDRLKIQVKKEQDYVRNRIETLAKVIEDMATMKIGVQQDILDAEQKDYELNKKVVEGKQQILELKNQIEDLTIRHKQAVMKLEPLEKEVTKISQLIPDLESENEKLIQQLGHLAKQSELSQQLRGINLEELKILKDTNDHVFNTLNEMSKKWDFLQKFAEKQAGK